jgi:hypothetical protein
VAKVTITLESLENGKVGVVFNPPSSEIEMMIRRFDDEGDVAPAVLVYAQACRDAIMMVHGHSSELAKNADAFTAKKQSKIWMPAYKNVISKLGNLF